jgi:hypothetical protein
MSIFLKWGINKGQVGREGSHPFPGPLVRIRL